MDELMTLLPWRARVAVSSLKHPWAIHVPVVVGDVAVLVTEVVVVVSVDVEVDVEVAPD